MPWRMLEGAASARAFAMELAAVPFAPVRGTSISASLTFVAGLFADNGFDGLRRVVDLSGDGPNNSGPPVEPARHALLEAGVVVNGLPIILKEPGVARAGVDDLELYYQDCVSGGPGSFVVAVRAAEQFAAAIRRKMVLEIASLLPPARIVRAGWTKGPKADCVKAHEDWRVGAVRRPGGSVAAAGVRAVRRGERRR